MTETHVNDLDLTKLKIYTLSEESYILYKFTPGKSGAICWIVDKSTGNILKRLDGEVAHEGSYIRRTTFLDDVEEKIISLPST